MQTEDIEQVQQLLVVETPGRPVMFDLRDVTLVNQDAVTFLADCEVKGIEIERFSPYPNLDRSRETPEQAAETEKRYAVRPKTAPNWGKRCGPFFRARRCLT
jgi:hypothetical protein